MIHYLSPPELAARRARRIADRYGVDALATVVEGLQSGRSHRAIADEVGVSGQCVGRWAADLGRVHRVYTVHADVRAVAEER